MNPRWLSDICVVTIQIGRRAGRPTGGLSGLFCGPQIPERVEAEIRAKLRTNRDDEALVPLTDIEFVLGEPWIRKMDACLAGKPLPYTSDDVRRVVTRGLQLFGHAHAAPIVDDAPLSDEAAIGMLREFIQESVGHAASP